jgi:hypothetical protein
MRREPLGATELAVTSVVAADCLAVNAAAVAFVPRLSLESLGPLALAFHDKQPHPAFLPVLVGVLLLGTFLPRGGRVAVLVFVGAAAANFLSPAIWDGGAPDYIVFRHVDVIANLSDLLMMSSGLFIAGTVAVAAARRCGAAD